MLIQAVCFLGICQFTHLLKQHLNIDHASMEPEIALSVLSPEKSTGRVVYSASQAIDSVSNVQTDRYYRDRFDRYIKVRDDRDLKRFVGMRRVDDGDDNPHKMREINGLSGKKEQYKALVEATHQRQKELQTQKQLISLKQQKIQELMSKLHNVSQTNYSLKKIMLASNQCNRQIYLIKKERYRIISQLNLQAYSKSKKIDEDLFVMVRQHKMSSSQRDNMKIKISQIQGKTHEMRHKQLSLDQEIDELTYRVKEEDETIAELNIDMENVNTQVKMSGIHVSVLKMQISPLLRVGFTTVSLDPEGDRKRILDKSFIVWPKNKIKTMSSSEIRDFLVMQLYPSWRRMLNKMSYQFVGYHQLLCYSTYSSEVPDLSLYLPQKIQSNRTTAGKTKSYIVVYSPLEDNREEIMKIVLGLQGLSNTILRVEDVRWETIQNGNKEIQIFYSFMGCERVKKLEVVQLKELTREAIIRWLPGKEDRTVLMKLQVPLILGSTLQRSQFEQVFDLLRRWR